jgi:homoserine kinase
MAITGNGRVRIRVPASTSNLGPAFDAVGLALQLYLTVDVQESQEGPSRVDFSGEDSRLIPLDESNYIWRSMREFAHQEGRRLPHFSLVVNNRIPIGKGLGSSSAALLAAAAAVSFLCGLGWTREKLIEVATAKEGHPDNICPAVLGGLVASICGEKTLSSKSQFPKEWTVIAVTPDLEISTEHARTILPAEVPREHAIHNIQRTAFLMAQLSLGRREGLREAMSDRLHQPYRGRLIPGLSDILSMNHREGLLGIALSGAGSTVIAFADAQAAEIGEAIQGIFRFHRLASQVRLLKADNYGISIGNAENGNAEDAEDAEKR